MYRTIKNKILKVFRDTTPVGFTPETMAKHLNRKTPPKSFAHFLLEAVWVNDEAFFWQVKQFEKKPRWMDISYKYVFIKKYTFSDRDAAMKGISEMSLPYDITEVIVDERIRS